MDIKILNCKKVPVLMTVCYMAMLLQAPSPKLPTKPQTCAKQSAHIRHYTQLFLHTLQFNAKNRREDCLGKAGSQTKTKWNHVLKGTLQPV